MPTINNNNNIIIKCSTAVLYHWCSKVYHYFTLIEHTSYGNNYFNLLDYYILLQILFHSNLNTQVIMNSIVHVYLHERSILTLQHRMIKYTDMGGLGSSGFCGDLHLDCMLHHFTSFHIARVVSQWKLRRRVLTRTRTQVSRMTTENSTTELWVTIVNLMIAINVRRLLYSALQTYKWVYRIHITTECFQKDFIGVCSFCLNLMYANCEGSE